MGQYIKPRLRKIDIFLEKVVENDKGWMGFFTSNSGSG